MKTIQKLARHTNPRVTADYAKVQVSIRLHPQVIKKLKLEAARQGIGYQTLAHSILAVAVGGIR